MLIGNEVDVGLTMSAEGIKRVLKQNPKVSTFSHDKPPYGYLDWWPTALGFNCSEPPFDDPEIRWAISYAINRKDVVTYGLQGLGTATRVTFPEFPSLVRYIESISDLFATYDPNAYDPQKTEEIMKRKGYRKETARVSGRAPTASPSRLSLRPSRCFKTFARRLLRTCARPALMPPTTCRRISTAGSARGSRRPLYSDTRPACATPTGHSICITAVLLRPPASPPFRPIDGRIRPLTAYSPR